MRDPIILDGQRLREYFASIAEDFVTTPQQMAIFAIVVALVLAALIVFARYQVRIARASRRKSSAQHAARLTATAKLTATEATLVAKLTGLLPRPREQAHLLLSSAARFDRVARPLLATEPHLQRLVASVRVKLGLARGRSEQRVVSTADLMPGQNVLLLHAGGRSSARVAENGAAGVRLEFETELADPAASRLHTGALVSLLLARQSGVYRFRTPVLDVSASAVVLAHSESARRAQQRAHYRRFLAMRVAVRRPGIAEWVATRLLDLGGNGASLVDRSALHGGEAIELRVPSQPPLQIGARVVRTSRRGRVAHLQFADIREADRDRIYRLILDTTGASSRAAAAG